MIVKDICTTNLDIVYEIAQEYGKLSSLPANISRILEKVVIFYQLNDVLPFELLALKKLGRIVDIKNQSTDTLDPGNFLANLNIQDLSTQDEVIMRKSIYSDKVLYGYKESSDLFSKKFGPIAAQMYSVNINLSGGDILNLYGFKLDHIFRDDDSSEYDLDPEHIQGRLLKGLMNAVYRVFNSIITQKDVFTDAWFNQQLYSMSNTDFMLFAIYDNLGNNIEFVNRTIDDATKDIVSARNSEYHAGREWVIEIVCRTTLAEYFRYLACSIRFDWLSIVDTSDFMATLSQHTKREKNFCIVGGDDDNHIPNLIQTATAYEDWFYREMNANKLDLIQRFMLAPANALISYTIHIKFPGITPGDGNLLDENCDRIGATPSNLTRIIETILKIMLYYDLGK